MRRWIAILTPFVLALALFILPTVALGSAVVTVSSSPTKNELVEMSFTFAGTFTNPFTDITLSVNFTPPAGSTLRQNGSGKVAVTGFYNGTSGTNQVMKARISPDVAGTWSYTTVSNVADLNGLTGSISVADSSSRGALIKMPNNPWSWQFRGTGEPFFDNGVTAFSAIIQVNSGTQVTAETFIDDRMANMGANRFRIWMAWDNPPIETYVDKNPTIDIWPCR